MGTLNNEAPGLVRGGQHPGIRPLFHSRREIALIKDKSLLPGFGVLNAGTVLGTAIDGSVVPSPQDDGSVDAVDAARARLLADVASSDTTLLLSEADAAKFRVGQDVVINNLTPEYEDLGAITAISAPVNGQVTITFTNAISAAVFTTANRAALSHKTAASTPFYASSCILDKDVDTGVESSTAAAVPVSVVFRNAMLYSVWLSGMSAKAITDLGATQDGVHTII